MNPLPVYAYLACAVFTQEGAQYFPSDEKPHESSFFSNGVDFWNTSGHTTKDKKSKKPDAPPPPVHMESIWAEPTRLPDGRYGIYVPPPAVLAFLESPTKESLQGYLAWRQERAKKLSKAMALLAEHRRSLKQLDKPETTPTDPSPEAPSTLAEGASPPSSSESGNQKNPVVVFYFTHPRCSACISQNEVFREWLKDRKDIDLKIITYGQSPELWEKYGITATPTMVFGTNGRNARLVGFKTAEQLNATISSLKRPELKPNEGKSPQVKPRFEKGEKE